MSLAVVAIWFVADARGDLLFSDNCYTTTLSSDVNQDIATRTGGKYAGTGYLYAANYSANTKVGESTYNYEDIRLGPGVSSSSAWAYIWLNQQLKGEDSAGGLELTWTASATLSSGTAYGTSWFTVGVGADEIGNTVDYRPLLSSTAGGVFVGFRLGTTDGSNNYASPCQMMVHEDGVAQSIVPIPNWLSGALEVPAVDHTFVMKVTGVGSDNPFSATTPLNIKLYVDGAATPVLDYTTANYYPNNYIGMLSYGYCRLNLDSWSVSQIPEPSTLALLTCGLFGLLAYAWRKRR